MTYMLDTNICIYLINKKSQKVISRFKKEEPGNIGISSITLSELKFGAHNSSNVRKNLLAVDKFTAPLHILNYDDNAADSYGSIRAFLKKTGNPIGPMDTLIAAHAIATQCILITNNVREFKKVKGLELQNWA